MRFTKEEIVLCKEIAKYYRRPIDYGDRVFDEDDQDVILIDNSKTWTEIEGLKFYRLNEGSETKGHEVKNWFPLWTWQDAREWLREKGWGFRQLNITDMSYITCANLERTHHFEIIGYGKTDLEAILKVVLEILKEEK